MAGIYIHIPFCKTKCTYCDFYSRTDDSLKKRFLDAVKKEIAERKTYLKDENVSTVYFGGGTPSTLSPPEISVIFTLIKNIFLVDEKAEITLEANPDDLNAGYLNKLKSIGINRLSIGVQSFDNKQLTFVKRRHSAEDATRQILNAQQAGFDNISIDLIYGLPFQTVESWKMQLEKAFSLRVQHISAYGLAYEKNTPLWIQKKKKQVTPTEDVVMNEMYEILVSECKKNGFIQYEISNFSLPGFQSKHNSSYWNLTPYIGLGPSAHSFDGNSRQWNISSIKKYCEALENKTAYFEKEILSEKDKFNDYIMIRLRTTEGLDTAQAETMFGNQKISKLLERAEKHASSQNLTVRFPFLKLTQKGVFISNQIIMDLMED